MRTRRAKAGQDSTPVEAPGRAALRRTADAAADPGAAIPAPEHEGGWAIAGRARSFRLDEGLYALSVGATEAAGGAAGDAGLNLPAICVAPAPAEDGLPVAIITSDDSAGWIGAGGGAVVVKVPPGGGAVLVTSYAAADNVRPPQIDIVDIRRLGGGAGAMAAALPAAAAAPPLAAPVPAGREITSELILHIERQGDRRLPGQGWAGNPGQRLRIEGFAIRPLEAIAPGDLEYMAYGPGGRQTPWVTDAKLCGTRGRGLPLTGFAIRLAPRLRERFDVVYEGYFFDGGVTGPARNGEPCRPAATDDPLAAIRLRVIERAGA